MYVTNENYLEKGCKCLKTGNWKLAVRYWEEGLKETLFTSKNDYGGFIKEREDTVGDLEHVLLNGKEFLDNRTGRFRPLIDEVYSLTAYRSLYDSESGDSVSALLRYLKKSPKEAQAVGYVLGKTLISFLKNNSNVLKETDIVIPVPISPLKRQERGYNQAELLTKPFEKLLNVPVRPKLLVKTRETADLRYLTAPKREKELRGAFKVTDHDSIAGNSILLIDDVITYGTTLKECARILRISGAEKIYVATIAKSESSTAYERNKSRISIFSGVGEAGNYKTKNTQPKTLNTVTTS